MINWEIIGLITWLERQQPRHILDTKDNKHNVGVGIRIIERKLQLSPRLSISTQPDSHSNEDATDVLPSVSLTAVARNVGFDLALRPADHAFDQLENRWKPSVLRATSRHSFLRSESMMHRFVCTKQCAGGGRIHRSVALREWPWHMLDRTTDMPLAMC